MTRIEDVWGDIDIGVEIPAIGIPGPTDWRPWVALSQAQYNAMQPEDFHPDILYIVGATRIYQGETNVFPPPFGGGIVNMTEAASGVASFPVTIPTTTPGNLLIVHASGGGLGANIATITDAAGQTWKLLDVGVSAAQVYYIEGSAAISQINFTWPTVANRSMRVFEVAGIADTNALDTNTPVANSGPGVTTVTATLTPNSHSFILAGVGHATLTNMTVNARPIVPPWTNLDDYSAPTSFIANAFTIGVPGVQYTARWVFNQANLGYFAVAFRVADTPSPR
jgi:hypothetical protein